MNAATLHVPGTDITNTQTRIVIKERKIKSSRQQDKPVALAPVLGAQQGMALHAELDSIIADPAVVKIDAGKVERVDTLAMQVLLAFIVSRQSAKREVSWSAVSTEFRHAAEMLGLSQALGLPA